RAGLVSGIGATSADLCYLAAVQLGLNVVPGPLANAGHWLRIVGAVAISLGGASLLIGSRRSGLGQEPAYRYQGLFASAFLLTISNPTLLLTITALVAVLGLRSMPGDYFSVSICLASVFIGSVFCWLVITGVVDRLQSKLTDLWLRKLNRITGA